MISSDEPEKIFCAREKSPLILGIHSGTNFVGSDINAFLPYRRQTVLLDDGEYAVVSSDGYSIRAISAGEMRYENCTGERLEDRVGRQGSVRALHEKLKHRESRVL
jgi:glucosamine--fructose-6-phosphate aminotransferase (isomerizing)